MHNDSEYWLSAALGLVLGALLGGAVVNCVWRWDAIEHGYGRYNERTGRWEWKPRDGSSVTSFSYYTTNLVYTNSAAGAFDKYEHITSDWYLVWSNWTNKPVAVARTVDFRLEEIPVQHDRPASY